MSQTKKAVILFLSLLLPVLIFVFLKSLGKNEFEVKPLFQDSVKSSDECKQYHYIAPYVIPDTTLTTVWSDQSPISLLVFDDKNQNINALTERLLKETSLKQIFLITVKADSVSINSAKAIIAMSMDRADFLLLRNCVLLLEPQHNAVLVDRGRRIMGQYDLRDLDETDRLIMETKIILKEY
jgi:hypothetical protein